ncbi:MAG: SLC13 family permease [Candidatus Palauibacterales bacterium]|nr:SLC13 family permease [Candidatus Palauibacterales bacterium]
MSLDAAVTLSVLALTLVAAAREWASLDLVVLVALFTLVVTRAAELETVLEGFSNPAVLTIGSLLVVAAGLRATGVLQDLAPKVLGAGGTLRSVLFRLTTTTAAGSAFLSNTALVAMGIPTLLGWSRRRGVPASKLLIPLSYASVLGGMCTLIGTSTNVVMDGLLEAGGMTGIGFFELAQIGVPLIVLAVIYLVFVAPKILPGRSSAELPERKPRRYVTEMKVPPGSSLAGQTVEESGLKEISGLFLVRLEREEVAVFAPVEPDTELAAGDRLAFAGVRQQIVELRRRRDLRTARYSPPGTGSAPQKLHEAVVSPGSPLVGSTVAEADFRPRYNAAVVAIHRHGEELDEPLDEVVLKAGDTLLLESAPGFSRAFRDAQDFYLVTPVEGSETLRREKKGTALGILGGVIVAAATGLIDLPMAALGGGVAMLATGCLGPGEARRSVDWSVLVLVGGAIGLAAALRSSGAAAFLGQGLEAAGDAFGPMGILVAVFLGTALLTEMIVNQAAAALAFPVVVAAAAAQGLDPRPLVIAATVAASFSFSTPLSYQTNLMVYGPGGYRFTDFVRAGLPMQLVLGTAAILLIWFFYPLGMA